MMIFHFHPINHATLQKYWETKCSSMSLKLKNIVFCIEIPTSFILLRKGTKGKKFKILKLLQYLHLYV